MYGVYASHKMKYINIFRASLFFWALLLGCTAWLIFLHPQPRSIGLNVAASLCSLGLLAQLYIYLSCMLGLARSLIRRDLCWERHANMVLTMLLSNVLWIILFALIVYG